jgi:hypothetical protein
MNRTGFFPKFDLRKGFTDNTGVYWEFTGALCANQHRMVADERGETRCFGCEDDGPLQ